MKKWIPLPDSVRISAQIVLIYIWLVTLVPLTGTDAFYSVYLLCALAGLVCVISNGKRLVSSVSRITVDLFAGVFSAAVALANYNLFSPLRVVENLFSLACCLAGGYVIGRAVLIRLLTIGADPRKGRKHSGLVGLLVFACIAAIDLGYLIFARYPGVLTTDSISTIRQIVDSSSYNNTMPFWHTMTVKVFVELGLLLTGDINFGVALFHCAQILFMAGCFGYAIATLHRAGAPDWVLWGISLLYGLMPFQIAYSVTLWKDVPFAGAALLTVTALYRILRRIGDSDGNGWALAAGAMGLCLWRTNGWYAMAVMLLLLALTLRRERKVLIVLGAVLAVSWVMLNPVLKGMGVPGTNYVEALAVPFQQVARVAAEGHTLAPEDQEMLEQIFYTQKLPEVYDPQTVDPVKFEAFRGDKAEFLREHWREYLSLYLRLGRRYPGAYARAWVDETKGYWNGGYDFWIYTKGIYGNDLGVKESYGSSAAARAYGALFRYVEKLEILQPLRSIGLYVWVLAACFLTGILQRKQEALLAVPMLVLLAGLWLGSPVYAEFRYAYPVILTTPVIACAILLAKGAGGKPAENASQEAPKEQA